MCWIGSQWCVSGDSPFLSSAHVCVPWLPALSSFPAYFSVPVSSVCDGTRCPWCYYPRTLPGTAGGRFPPIIVISNGRPGDRERVRELFSFCLSFTLWFCPWQPAAKVWMYFMVDLFKHWESKYRNNLQRQKKIKKSDPKTRNNYRKKKSHTNTIFSSFYFQASWFGLLTKKGVTGGIKPCVH